MTTTKTSKFETLRLSIVLQSYADRQAELCAIDTAFQADRITEPERRLLSCLAHQR
jgi:hypothetical protein